jgi:biopolymer transport protein ExbB/TolQ
MNRDDVVDTVRRAIQRATALTSNDLKKGIPSLATIGSTAPFVGLLGTVVGVISAFQGIATTGSGGLGAVSAGISEALIETALGLVVAIPGGLDVQLLHGPSRVLQRRDGQLVVGARGLLHQEDGLGACSMLSALCWCTGNLNQH